MRLTAALESGVPKSLRLLSELVRPTEFSRFLDRLLASFPRESLREELSDIHLEKEFLPYQRAWLTAAVAD